MKKVLKDPFWWIIWILAFLAGTLVHRAAFTDDNPWCGDVVLIVGDSLVGDGSGLEMGLRKRLEGMGAIVDTEWRMGARPNTIQKDHEVQKKIVTIAYDRIIVSLGMNSSRSPTSVFEREVKDFALLRQRKQDCYWIGPPVLVEGTGFAVAKMRDVVEKHTNCRYYETAGEIEFPPNSVSGFHVRRWKGKKWAAKVWEWMQ